MISWILIIVASALFSIYLGKLLSLALQARTMKRTRPPATTTRRWVSDRSMLWVSIDDLGRIEARGSGRKRMDETLIPHSDLNLVDGTPTDRADPCIVLLPESVTVIPPEIS